MATATLTDVEDRALRDLTTAETLAVATLLEDAETILRRRISDFDDQLADATWSALVVQVEASAVLRYLRNPNGVQAETIGEYSYTREESVSPGAVYISDDEWDLLVGGATSGDAFTITPAYTAPE